MIEESAMDKQIILCLLSETARPVLHSSDLFFALCPPLFPLSGSEVKGSDILQAYFVLSLAALLDVPRPSEDYQLVIAVPKCTRIAEELSGRFDFTLGIGFGRESSPSECLRAERVQVAKVCAVVAPKDKDLACVLAKAVGVLSIRRDVAMTLDLLPIPLRVC